MPDSPLATATPARLEACAATVDYYGAEHYAAQDYGTAAAYRIAADLLRAVAKAERTGVTRIEQTFDGDCLCYDAPIPEGKAYGRTTLPAALASLLTTPPAGADDGTTEAP